MGGNVATNDPQDALRSGDVLACKAAQMERVKAAPGEAKERAFLSQIFMVEGDWDRAVKQLQMLADLQPDAIDLVTDYCAALAAERARIEVMAGRAAPSIMGEPGAWLAKLVEALRLDAAGASVVAYALRNEAFAEAPASPGEVDGTQFNWLSDADNRLGPVLEAVMNGEYHWIPFNAIATIKFEPPKDLRDVVWTVGIITLTNGGEWPILVPTRYPGSDTLAGADSAHALARQTDWSVLHDDHYKGIGQRMFATDEKDIALLDVRELTFHQPDRPDVAISDIISDGG